MRYALFGGTGLLGTEILQELKRQGLAVHAFRRQEVDLEYVDKKRLEAELEGFDFVINAAAYTNVDQAETNSDIAGRLNANFPRNLALATSSVGNKLIHISTDYVFSGDQLVPYKVAYPTNPVNTYGKSKALGEQLVLSGDPNSTIVRTSWLYGANKNSFPQKIIAKFMTNDVIEVVSDQIGQPTWARDVAEHIVAYSKLKKIQPIVHIASAGQASWADFAVAIADSCEFDSSRIIPVSSSESKSLAPRPKYSVLDLGSGPIPPIGDWLDRWNKAHVNVIGATYT